MIRYIFLTVVLFILIGKSTFAQILEVNEVIQEQSEWCWTGVSKCILDYYGNIVDQCEIAEYTRTNARWHNYGNTNCCTDVSKGCNYWNYNYGYDGSILNILKHFGSIDNYGTSSVITEAEIDSELSNKRPFVIRWAWYSGGGHFVVGHGKDDKTIYYMNPWYGEGLKFADYSWVVDDGNHKWEHTNIITTNPVNIFENKAKPKNQIMIAPNPSDGSFTISYEDSKKTNSNIQIDIINSTGQIIYSQNFKGTFSESYSLLNLSKGLYIIKASGGDFAYTERLLIN